MHVINTLLKPDQNNIILKYYHKSNKTLLPLLIPSFFLDENNRSKIFFDLFNITNLSFHSYVSFSTIITDYYKKIPFINEKLLRLINVKSHSIVLIYFTYYLYEKNNEKNNDKYLKK